MTQESKERTVTVGEFFEAGEKDLKLEVEEGASFLDTVVQEPSLNRPGLALAGFFKYFALHRIQVFGLAELTYLKNLPKPERLERVRRFFEHHIPAVVVTRKRHAPKEMIDLAPKYRVPILRSPLITMHFINAGTLVLEDLISPRMHAQGTMLDILGMGVLIEGDPGIGKSETALALIERGHSLVADDLTILKRNSAGDVIGSAVEITRYHMEIRGLGLIHVPSLFGVGSMRDSKRLDLVIRLIRSGPDTDIDRTGLAPKTKDLLGVPVPFITIPVAPGRDIAHVVAVAALNQRLKRLGHDAAKELDERLLSLLARKGHE